MMPDRREVLTGAAALALGAALPARAADTAASFLVLGDWGRYGAAHQREIATAMDTVAGETAAKFVVAVGDNFYEDGVTGLDDPHWKESFEDVYTGAHLGGLPWYVALGNHDYGGVPQAQVDYSAVNPRWKMPARYFAVPGSVSGAPGLDMFVVDTNPLVRWYQRENNALGANVRSQDGSAQLAWLEAQLAASTAPCKIVFGHHTMFSGGSVHGDTPDIISRLLPMLRRHGVAAYICGHDHDLQHIVREKLDVVCSGAGAEARPTSAVRGTKFCAAKTGFAVITVRGASIGVEFRDASGKAIYRSETA